MGRVGAVVGLGVEVGVGVAVGVRAAASVRGNDSCAIAQSTGESITQKISSQICFIFM